MKFSLLAGYGLLFCSPLMFTGCMDDNYDLSDIDTTTEIRFNDLVLPANIAPLRLDNVISLDDDDKIKIVDGRYAVLVDGEFESDEIEVNKVNASAPRLNQVRLTLPGTSGSVSTTYPIPSHPEDFKYHTDDVDDAICSIDQVEVAPMRMGISIALPDLAGKATKVTVKNLKLKFPSGTIASAPRGTYDGTNCILTVPEAIENLAVNGNASAMDFYVNVTGVNFNSSNSSFNADTHEFSYHGAIEILSGEIMLQHSDMNQSSAAPSSTEMRISYIFDDFTAKDFTGDIHYNIDNFGIDPVNLDDLPDFLSQEGTNIILGNPQIYLSLNNPLANYGLHASTDLKLTAIRTGENAVSFTPEAAITLGADKGIAGPYEFCYSPEKPEKYYNGYQAAKHVAFSTLGNVLSGNGLPGKIEIDAVNPQFPRQKVTKFILGTKIQSVKGKYSFFAPLDLEEGSNIIYSDSDNGWADDELDAVTIEHIELTMNVSTDVNAKVRLTGYPIDASGNKIKGVEVTGAEIPANAKDYPVKIFTTGEIQGIDGFVYTVYAAPGQGSAQLSPTQEIVIKNVRAKASGKYCKEL